MTTRIAMTSLITLVRGLINDPAGVGAQFTDEDIQQNLDDHREYILNEELDPLPQPDETTYLKWQSSRKHWESDVIFVDPAGTALVPDTANYINGYFTFASHCDQVYANGFCYDVYAACAMLLMTWAGRIEQDITKFSADGSSYEFAGQKDSKLAMASEYAKKSKAYGSVRSIGMVRNDHNTN